VVNFGCGGGGLEREAALVDAEMLASEPMATAKTLGNFVQQTLWYDSVSNSHLLKLSIYCNGHRDLYQSKYNCSDGRKNGVNPHAKATQTYLFCAPDV